MDMRQYAPKYIKPDTVRDAPLQTRVVNVVQSERYNRPALELENGSQFTLNDSNTRTLVQAWGTESDDWIGLELVFELGVYRDWRDDPPSEKETVKVRAVSPGKAGAQNGAAPSKAIASKGGARSLRDEMDDDIPFM